MYDYKKERDVQRTREVVETADATAEVVQTTLEIAKGVDPVSAVAVAGAKQLTQKMAMDIFFGPPPPAAYTPPKAAAPEPAPAPKRGYDYDNDFSPSPKPSW